MIAVLPVTEIVRDPQRFAALAKDWDLLAAKQGTPLAFHAWYSAALAVQDGAGCQIESVTIWQGNRLIAVAPLMREAARSLTRLVPIDAFAGEPDRLLYESPLALGALAKACARLNRPILLRRLSASDADLPVLISALQSGASVIHRPLHSSATVNLPPDFEQFEGLMSNNRRATIRRKWRAAEREHGEVRAEIVTPKPRELPAALARIEAIESAGWKGRSGTSLAADPRMRNFISRVAQAFAAAGELVLAFLKIGDQDVACRLILRRGAEWFEIKIGYDESFGRFSPGVLLMHETLREACRRGIESYAFLGLREGWQDHWPHMAVEDYRIATYPFSIAGGLAFAADGLQALGSIARRFRR